jgi:prephenate dehydrogenase
VNVSGDQPSLKRVSVIGLGLMGGSLALALRRCGVAEHIVGCGRTELLRRAQEMGAIDSGSVDAAESVAESDFVFLCTPVETSIGLMARIAPGLRPGALVSDVGSTKSAFAKAAREIFGASAHERVLPGHPLAGRELSGLEHASADLYAGCTWVLTPLEATEQGQLPHSSKGALSGASATSLNSREDCPTQAESRLEWATRPTGLTAAQYTLHAALEAIGARVIFATPEEHDHALAYTSHLPQMLSSALALTLGEVFGGDSPALQVHAGGLKSMLRLAGSDPAMWEQIAASNRANIAEALERLEDELRKLRESLGSAEFRKRFEKAKEFAKFVKE